ncbi:MAG: endo-1,3-alpha-glucanase family glycosylhydrolase [Candidatus Thiodiazotropha sp. 6PDIVS]
MLSYCKTTRRNFIKRIMATILSIYTTDGNSNSNKPKSSRQSTNDSRKWAFAHYMTGLCTRKRKQTIDEWKQDILDALEYEIDGWQFNFSLYEGMFKKNINNFLIALEELDVGPDEFKFFPSFDCNHGRVPKESQIIDWFDNYYNHPNHFRLNRLPLLTVWQARDVGSEYFVRIKNILANKGMPVSFIPYVSSRPNVLEMLKLFNEWSVMDGFFTWVAGQSSDKVIRFNKIASTLCKRFGKTLMAGHGYSYLAINKRPFFVNKNAAEAVTNQMMPLINGEFGECDILNVSTWNDYGEDHHISPHPPWGPVPVGSVHPVWCHIGYALVIKYYLKWWKAGKPPAIHNDTIAVFHLTQLAGDGVPPFPYEAYKPDKEQNIFYLTSILKEPGDITVISGNNDPAIFHAPAGISHWRTSSSKGEQKYSLWRNGELVFKKTSRMQISFVKDTPWTWSRYTEVVQK